jgi:hypothetical protein
MSRRSATTTRCACSTSTAAGDGARPPRRSVAGALAARARRAPPWLWAVPALLFLSVVFLAVETPRYRTPLDPFVILLAAVALTAAGDAITRAMPGHPLRSGR